MLRGTEVCARRTTRTDERTLKRRGTREDDEKGRAGWREGGRAGWLTAREEGC